MLDAVLGARRRIARWRWRATPGSAELPPQAFQKSVTAQRTRALRAERDSRRAGRVLAHAEELRSCAPASTKLARCKAGGLAGCSAEDQQADRLGEGSRRDRRGSLGRR
jgi:hypothetical protein